MRTRMTRRQRWVWMAGMLALLTLGASEPAGEPWAGPFTAEPVRAPECTSPVGLCTHGVLRDAETGRAIATYDFTMLTLVPTGDGTRATFTGESVISKIVGAPGVLYGQDEGEIQVNPLGPSPFTTRVHVVGGTDSYQGASGLITATGGLDLLTGRTEGAYEGTIHRHSR